MLVRCVRQFRWAGEGVIVGHVLDVTPDDAYKLVHGYTYCVYVDGPVKEEETPTPRPKPKAMVTHGDPAIEYVDPVFVPTTARRLRKKS